jgi:hypothetical protein
MYILCPYKGGLVNTKEVFNRKKYKLQGDTMHFVIFTRTSSGVMKINIGGQHSGTLYDHVVSDFFLCSLRFYLSNLRYHRFSS